MLKNIVYIAVVNSFKIRYNKITERVIEMKKAIPLGIMDYEKLIKDDYYAVDKTLMIKDFLKRKSSVTLITRPRRFGKTLNMSMLANFFDITKDSKEIFKDTKIMKTNYADQINQYPTIFITFAGAKNSLQEIVSWIKRGILKEYQRYKFILNDLDEFDKPVYEAIKKELINFDNNQLNDITDSLSFLMEQLEKYYQKKVMLFIDEYDTPFIEGHVGGFYNEIKGGLAGLLHNALKLSSSLQYAMLTGIQRVAKESIFSDLNNLIVCTVMDKRYDQYFGFTETETETLLKYYDLRLNDEVREMYDGYHMGEVEIYNPWSIINYADNKELIPYWVNTSSNIMIKKVMEKSEVNFKEGYETLIRQGYLDTQIMMETSFYEQSQTESLWGLFVNAGYLTIEQMIRKNRYRIRIPNEEVQQEFMSLTAYYLQVSESILDDLFYAVETKDKKLFENSYKNILMTLPSYYDLKDENSYHMMVLGMCAWLCHDYKIISNREAGKGRCDIVLKARKENQISYILEFKYAKDSNTDLNELAKRAVEQIKDRKYDIELRGNVIYIGLAHYQKEVEIEWQEN